MTLQEWDCFMQHLLNISFAWENSFISLKSFILNKWRKRRKKKKWTLGRVYLIFSQRYVSLICFILSCQAYRQLRRKMRTWRKKVAKRRSREIEHKRWRKKGKVLKLMKDVDEEEDETNSWFLLQKLRSRSTLRYWWVKLLEDADY